MHLRHVPNLFTPWIISSVMYFNGIKCHRNSLMTEAEVTKTSDRDKYYNKLSMSHELRTEQTDHCMLIKSFNQLPQLINMS